MTGKQNYRAGKVLSGAAAVALLMFGVTHVLLRAPRSAADAATDSWTGAQTVEPAALAKELADPQQSKRPTVVCVAPHVLYVGGHIPGASFHGPGMSAPAIDDLKTWAKKLPLSTDIVVYCGCCPLDRCPNLRPAFEALRSMGFTRVRALLLPTNFYTDWVKPGYPVEKGD